MHEIHAPKSTQQKATVIVKYYIPFQEKRGGKISKKFFNKMKTVEIICSCFMFCLLNLISVTIEQNMITFHS